TKEGYGSFSNRRLQLQMWKHQSFKLFRNFEQANIYSVAKHFKIKQATWSRAEKQNSAIKIVPQNNYKYKKAKKEKKMIINAIQESSIEVIPRSKRWCKEFYAFSKQITKLHVALKETNKLVRMLKKKEVLFLKVLNKTINKINKLAEVHIDKLEQIDIQGIQIEYMVRRIKQYQIVIHKAKNIENNIEQREKINQHINRRIRNFKENTKKMIDSILESESGLKKATGPLNISNKMLRHLSEKVLENIIVVFNKYLMIKGVPTEWKRNKTNNSLLNIEETNIQQSTKLDKTNNSYRAHKEIVYKNSNKMA
ncbi:37206_t:CDS:2, partial [Gigaspora margarita]